MTNKKGHFVVNEETIVYLDEQHPVDTVHTIVDVVENKVVYKCLNCTNEYINNLISQFEGIKVKRAYKRERYKK